jgi:hypothetical protein
MNLIEIIQQYDAALKGQNGLLMATFEDGNRGLMQGRERRSGAL